MKKMLGQEIREMWLDFFKSKGHEIQKGASLIPYQDPSLLWINSGVAALKKYMDGSEIPPKTRIANIQKSLRTNDMDNVGYTARHQTFFEMMGCFSIGDYFKKEIIAWAFEILTSEIYFNIPKNLLFFSYNPIDTETKNLWLKQGVSEDHLIPLSSNYWEIGEGPAGPNTEVFFDRGESYDPKHLGVKLLKDEIENDRYIELWGIVFSQYNARHGVKREDYLELPKKNIDTGAGLERFALVLQGTETNFETDLFFPIIKEIESKSSKKYIAENKTAYRVIADHIRALTFALSDGASFSNEGRGYVLRRLLRRALRFAKKLDLPLGTLPSLVPTVVKIYEDFYPELKNNSKAIMDLISIEENQFNKTLKSGESLLNELIANQKVLSGELAFKLYDTYGFPLDLTKEICREKNVLVDEIGFNEAMKKQKELARNARGNDDSMHRQSSDLLSFKEKSVYQEQSGIVKSKVIALFIKGEKVDKLLDEGEVILSNTSFYAESGGEVADTGVIQNENFSANVIDVKKAPNKQHLHLIKISKGELKVGDEVEIQIDNKKHQLIKRNHSATHLLQSALDIVLGDNIKQMGSFVSDEYLRFDFSCNRKLTSVELSKVEQIVNQYIAEAIPSEIRLLPISEANKLGAKAFFSEKYGDIVRVVKFGDVSLEFCGGCHVENTESIGIFKIVKEEAIASGVRRIEAKTSLGAYSLITEKEQILANLETRLGAKSLPEILDRLNAVLAELVNVKEEKENIREKLANIISSKLEEEIKNVGGIAVLTKYLKDESRDGLLKLGDSLKSKHPNYLFVLVGGNNNNYPLLVLVGGDALKNLKANEILNNVAKYLDAHGGGSNKIANGVAKNITNLERAFKEVESQIK